jgi:hypothetical protein
MERVFEVSFSWFAPFVKAYTDDAGEAYVVVKASDTSVDRDNEKISKGLIEKMKRLAAEGKLILLDHHRATFPLGVSVGNYEGAPDDAFYPVFKLDRDHPFSGLLLKHIQEGRADYGVSIGGKNPKLSVTFENGRAVTEIIDAEVDHVALTRKGYQANPNTGIVRAILKEIGEARIGELVKEAAEAAGISIGGVSEDGVVVGEGTDAPAAGQIVLHQVTPLPAEHLPPASEAEAREKGKDENKKKKEKDEKDEKEAEGEGAVTEEVGKGAGMVDKEILDKVVEEITSLKSIVRSRLGDGAVSTAKFAAELEEAIAIAKSAHPLDKSIFEREKKYGYERGIYACAVKPPAWQELPEDEFADPVGYLYPASEPYFPVSYQHFITHGYKWYLPESAAAVFRRFIDIGMKQGYPVSYHDHPLLASQLPTDIKVMLNGYKPALDELMQQVFKERKEWAEQVLIVSDAALIKEQEDEDEIARREKKYGYPAPSNANVRKPSEWADVPESKFADPVGYKYPVHTPENARAALTYFAKPQNRSFYTVDAQVAVLSNILRACLRYGIKVAFKPDDPLYWLLPDNIKKKLVGYEDYEDEDTEERREAARAEAEKTALRKEVRGEAVEKESKVVEKEGEVIEKEAEGGRLEGETVEEVEEVEEEKAEEEKAEERGPEAGEASETGVRDVEVVSAVSVTREMAPEGAEVLPEVKVEVTPPSPPSIFETTLVINLPVKTTPAEDVVEILRAGQVNLHDQVAAVVDVSRGIGKLVMTTNNEAVVTVIPKGDGIEVVGKGDNLVWLIVAELERILQKSHKDARVVYLDEGTVGFEHDGKAYLTSWGIEGGVVTIKGGEVEAVQMCVPVKIAQKVGEIAKGFVE